MDWYLEADKGGTKFPLTLGITTVGRTPKSTIQLDSTYCSRQHCSIEVRDDGTVKISDFSTNGTYVNGECYINMDIMLSEHDKIGIGWWPFESVAPQDVTTYTLRKEEAPGQGVKLEEEHREEGSTQKAADIILISDDEDDKLDLEKYVCGKKPNDATAIDAERSTAQTKDGANIEVGDFVEPPQFLPTASNSKSPANSSSDAAGFPQISDAQFLPSGTMPKQLTKNFDGMAGNASTSYTSREIKEENTTPRKVDEVSGCQLKASLKCEPNAEDLEFESQSTLLDIKQEMADLDYEQSFEIKHEQLEKLETNQNDALVKEVGVVETSPIYIIDDDDEDDADDVNLNNWANKLSQSFNSQTAMVRIHDQDATSALATKVDNNTNDYLGRTLFRLMRRSLSLDEIVPPLQGADEKETLKKEEKPEVKRGTRQSFKKDIQDSAKSESNDVPQRSSVDSSTPSDIVHPKQKGTEQANFKDVEAATTKRGIKHKLLSREPVPSTSRASSSIAEAEFNHLEAKRKKPEVIEAPNLRTGRGKLRGHSLGNQSSVHGELERKIQRARMSNEERLMKAKWRQKPSAERNEEKNRLKNIREQCKLKLKEMGEKQAQKRKSEAVEQKTVKKPKVKVTERNRGAYLAEELEAAKLEVHSKRIPKLQSRESVDETKSSPDDKMLLRKHSSASTDAVETSKTEISRRSSGKVVKQTENERKSPIRRNSMRNSISKDESHTSKRTANNLKSILKADSSKRKNLSVQFINKPEIKYFEIEEGNNLTVKVDNCKDAPTSTVVLESITKRAREFRPDYSAEMINDILQWNPYWLGTELQEVNGPKHEPMMMVQKYQSYEEFANIVLPLFKLELWSSIQRDVERRRHMGSTVFNVNESFTTPKGKHVLHCEANINNEKEKFEFTALQLCIIDFKTKSSQSFQAFGIIASMRCYGINKSQHSLSVYVELKANKDLQSACKEATCVQLKPVTNIRVEVGIYNAIKNLQYSPLNKCILDPSELLHGSHLNLKNIKYKGYNQDLNPNQMSILLAAYERCVDDKKTNNLFLIEGPPGTGKSRIIINLALQTLYGSELKHSQRSKKILICAQSNTAIDIIALKLLEIRGKMDRDKFNLVRFGVLERIHPGARPISLQKLVQSRIRDQQTNADRNTLKNEKKLLEKQIESLRQKANQNTIDIDTLKKKQDKVTWINNRLFADVATTGLESHYPKFLAGAHIVCTTLSSCIKLLNYVKKFDVCIIDEATQCAEPYTLIPLQFGISSLILVGDTQQLPATVLSEEANARGFGRSLFTRIQDCIADEENCPIQMLKTQYRMHPEICMWPNSYFYKNILINHESTRQTVSIVKPYAVLSLEYVQDSEQEIGKLQNVNEATFVVTLVSQLSKLMSPDYFSYGIITPYAQHKDYLQKKINEAGLKKVLVNTIDSYQGKEKDVMILSCVRTKGIGFLGNCQRLNVALTRAKKCLLVCGNFTSLKREPVWNILLDNAKRRNLLYHISPKDVADFDNKVMCHIRTNIVTGTNST